MHSEKQPLSRRRFLAAAVTFGSLVTLHTMSSPGGKAYAASLDEAYGANVPMRLFPAGKGIIRTYKHAFTSKDVEGVTYFTANDGRIKIAYRVIGLANQFQVVDAASGKNEYAGTPPARLNAPISGIGWNKKDGYIYSTTSGTVSQYNHATKTFKNLGQVTTDSTTGYGPVFDSSGNGWYGSYPDAGVGKFSPINGVRTAYPSVDEKSDYVRSITTLGDTVYCGTGAVSPKIVSFPIANPTLRKDISVPAISATGFVHKLDAHAGRIFASYETSTLVSKCSVYNPSTGQWSDFKYKPWGGHMTSLPGDSWVYFVAKTYPEARNSIVRWNSSTNVYETLMAAPALPNGMQVRKTSTATIVDIVGDDITTGLIRSYSVSLASKSNITNAAVNVIAAAYKVQDFIASADGKLYVGGYQGDGIASIDLTTDARWKSGKSDPIHQIEGMMEYGSDRIYVGSYGSADLIRFDKAKGAATLIQRLRTDYMQSRPFAWALAAGKVITGTVPEYGLRGGAMAIIDPVTDTVEKVLNKYIPEQSIIGLVGNGDIVYGTTSVKGGYGIADDTAPATVFAHNVKTGVQLWKNTSLTHETEINSPVIAKGRLFVGVANGIIEIDINTGKTLKTWKLFSRINTAGYRNIRLAYHAQTNRLVHCGGGTITAVGLANDSRSILYQGTAGTMDISPAGKIYAVTGDSMDISEIDSVYSPAIASTADVIAISPSGGISLRRSNGAGGYSAPFDIVASGYADAKSVHIADWNGNGIYDLVSNHSDGTLRIRYGLPNGEFEPFVTVSSSDWDKRRIAVDRWNYATYRPSVISIDATGMLQLWQVSSTLDLGLPEKLGTGWKAQSFAILDKNYDKNPGLVVKEGTNLYWYPSSSLSSPLMPRDVMTTGGHGGTTQFSVVQKHRYDYDGIVWHDGIGTLRYVSNMAGKAAGILTYGVTWVDYRLGGASL